MIPFKSSKYLCYLYDGKAISPGQNNCLPFSPVIAILDKTYILKLLTEYKNSTLKIDLKSSRE